jgi:hypothetical protein
MITEGSDSNCILKLEIECRMILNDDVIIIHNLSLNSMKTGAWRCWRRCGPVTVTERLRLTPPAIPDALLCDLLPCWCVRGVQYVTAPPAVRQEASEVPDIIADENSKFVDNPLRVS